ncbi:O-antigen ligase family protein [Bifidobacterium simiiventris]|uniref:O-antigen ligase family protein n=1 Tax=Bifidobacterium simiiventris TaxID=2834434 RepID=UPI001C56CE71|nr:O-antigen ligase family protein [Bifidobacterium simiiventris]MBW3078679.1 O-antigen ligase family protein [Bifidobacterium simiiventris]
MALVVISILLMIASKAYVYLGGLAKNLVFIVSLFFASYVILIGLLNNEYYGRLNNAIDFAYSFGFFALFCFYTRRKGKQLLVINIFYYCTLFWVVLSDALMFSVPQYNDANNYLLGNKFTVSYIHIFLFCLYLEKTILCKKPLNNIFLIIYSIFVFSIILYCSCTTALVGFVILLVMLVLHHYLCVLSRPFLPVLFIILADSILIIIPNILKLSFVKGFIEGFLGKDLTLTGRTYIYKNVIQIIRKNIFFGNGWGSAYSVMTTSLGANTPNAQNGLLNLMVELGIVGVLLFCLFVYICFYSVSKSSLNDLYPINSYCYILIILSMVEITFQSFFFGCVLLITIFGENGKIVNGDLQ